MQPTTISVGVIVGRIAGADWNEKGVITVREKEIEVVNARNRFSSKYEEIFTEERPRSDLLEFAGRTVEKAVRGYNAAVILYGPTGSGKTSELVGRDVAEHQRSLTWHCIHSLFTQIHSSCRQFSLSLSALFIHNEKLYDLLSSQVLPSVYLKESTEIGLYLSGLSTYPVSSTEETYGFLLKAISNLSKSPYSLRASSTLFRVNLTSQKPSKHGNFRYCCFDLWDLAGSERTYKGFKSSENHTLHLSITHLNKVTSTLANTGKLSAALFKASKVGKIMQNVIVGGYPCILVTVSPVNEYTEETIYALKFADSAKKIPLRLNKNRISEENVGFVRFLQKEVAILRDFLHENGQDVNWDDPFPVISRSLSIDEIGKLIKQKVNLQKLLLNRDLIETFTDKNREEEGNSAVNSSVQVAATAPVPQVSSNLHTQEISGNEVFTPEVTVVKSQGEVNEFVKVDESSDMPGACDDSSYIGGVSSEYSVETLKPPSIDFLEGTQRYKSPFLERIRKEGSVDRQVITHNLRRTSARDASLAEKIQLVTEFRQQAQKKTHAETQEGLQDRIDEGIQRMEAARLLHQKQLEDKLLRDKEEALSLRKKLNQPPRIQPRGVRPKASLVAQLLAK